MLKRELEMLRKEGMPRLCGEALGLILLVMVAYDIALDPFLQSLAPDLYTQPMKEGRRFPTTPSGVTRMFFMGICTLSHLFWRVNCTDLGQTITDSMAED